MAGDAIPLIEQTATRLLDEVPALKPMTLIIGIQLQGRGDIQHFRLELGGRDGLKATKDIAADAKVRVEMRREFFNEMAKDAKIADWREAFTYGQAKATGPTQILQLVERVVEKQEERIRLQHHRRG